MENDRGAFIDERRQRFSILLNDSYDSRFNDSRFNRIASCNIRQAIHTDIGFSIGFRFLRFCHCRCCCDLISAFHDRRHRLSQAKPAQNQPAWHNNRDQRGKQQQRIDADPVADQETGRIALRNIAEPAEVFPEYRCNQPVCKRNGKQAQQNQGDSRSDLRKRIQRFQLCRSRLTDCFQPFDNKPGPVQHGNYDTGHQQQHRDRVLRHCFEGGPLHQRNTKRRQQHRQRGQ